MRTALIVIDIQREYFPGGALALNNVKVAAKMAGLLLMKCRMANVPVVFMQHIESENAKFFRPGSTGIEIHELATPLPNELVLQKNYPNSFRGTHLLEWLNQHKITNLIVCGMMTHMCVDSTVRAASDLGFKVQLIEDACTTKDLYRNDMAMAAQEVHQTFLAALDGSFASVIKLDDLDLTDLH